MEDMEVDSAHPSSAGSDRSDTAPIVPAASVRGRERGTGPAFHPIVHHIDPIAELNRHVSLYLANPAEFPNAANVSVIRMLADQFRVISEVMDDLRNVAEVAVEEEEEEEEDEEEEEAAAAAAPPADAVPDTSETVAPQSSAAPSDAAHMGEKDTKVTEAETGAESAAVSSAPPSGEADDSDNCTICLEPWTAVGEHQLSALRCGHIFGFTCINRWLTNQGRKARCPQCNKPARSSHVVKLYATRLRPVDNSAKELVESSAQRSRMEAEYAYNVKLLKVECYRLSAELQALKSQAASQPLVSSQPESSQAGSKYAFSSAVLLSQMGGCRVLAYSEPLGCLLASQPSPESTLIPGFGVKKISVATMRAFQYVPIHSQQIRSLAFSRQPDSLLLSASLDGTVKLTSLLTNTVVQTYNAGRPVWSCCWNLDDRNYVYAGLNNGCVRVYDTRDTSTHVQELLPQGSRAPLASLSYIPRGSSSTFPCGGLVAGSLAGGCFWEQVDGTTFRPHVLQLENSGCTDIQVEPDSSHCLVTYRPGRSNPSTRCVLMELRQEPQENAAHDPACFCIPIQNFTIGSSCKLLTKNAVFRSPARDGSMLVCAGDEASSSTTVWNAGSGALIQKLPADMTVLDICPFEVNQSSYLASLTEKMLKIYKWE